MIKRLDRTGQVWENAMGVYLIIRPGCLGMRQLAVLHDAVWLTKNSPWNHHTTLADIEERYLEDMSGWRRIA